MDLWFNSKSLQWSPFSDTSPPILVPRPISTGNEDDLDRGGWFGSRFSYVVAFKQVGHWAGLKFIEKWK